MKLGLVGLGRMGGGIAARLRDGGHEVVAYDLDASLTEAPSIEALVASLPSPRAVWLMIPAGEPTQGAVDALSALLTPGDVIVEGGNSHYRDSQRRAAALAAKGIDLLDCGTSGGVWGRQNGFCLMLGGPKPAFDALEPVFATLAPPSGYQYLGPSGAGHFAKMAHNGVEYGLLQAYAEGFSLLEASGFDYDLARLSDLWGRGSVVRSWLLELAQRAFEADPKLANLQGYVEDSGEGRWAVQEAVERGLPLPAITLSLYRRFASRDGNPFANRFIAALRNQFGGHAVRDG
ncbi:MAG TPA: decarboxylating 6-phosphogluconate dehydrogenase [Dehalococcoidia bacterium]|nr:decarboxylating 6-phosphogluconate dehydrogenase [Dehalococcoidia bacterium]